MVHIKRSDHMGETEKAAQGSFPAVSSFSPESAASSGKADAPCHGLANSSAEGVFLPCLWLLLFSACELACCFLSGIP